MSRIEVLLTLTTIVMSAPGASHADTTHPRIQWSFQTEGPIRGSAALSKNAVYFGSADGFIYAVNKADGSLQWKFQTGGAIAGAPAIADSTVIVAGRGTDAYALDAADGSVKWSFRMKPTLPTPTEWNYFTAPPVIDGEQVFIGSGDGHLYALDLATGRQQWAFKTGDSVRAAPLIVEDTIYQPSGDDHVYALSRKNGTLLWKFATAGVGSDLSKGYIRSDIFTRPSLQQGLLVFGSRDANVYAVDVATRTKKWSFAYDSTWAMSTLADEDTVYVGWSTNNKINALALTTGKQRWEFDAGSHTYTTALVLDDDLYFGSANGTIHELNKRSGERRWSYSVGSDVYSSLVHDAGILYFGTDDGRLIALTQGPAPSHKAVYLPATVPERIRGFIIDPALEPHLRTHGYARLDSADALASWLRERTDDDAPSVLVFAFAQIPPAVIGEDPSTGAMRRYLEAGGKVMWPWGLPNKYTFDAEGNFLAHDPSVARRLLDVEFQAFEDSGNYYSRATQTGRNWGMPVWLKTTFSSLQPGNDVTVLAVDEYGRTSAFVKRLHPRVGSGWVSYSPKGFGVPITQAELTTFEHVASYAVE
jgi:outer membrane protein assembly factor BamB